MSLIPSESSASVPSFASLKGKRVVVTGSSSGIGKAIAMSCAEAGASVVIHCRSSVREAEAVANVVRRLGQDASVICANLADATQRHRFAEQCFETAAADALVNNAGADLLTTNLRNAEYSTKLQVLWDTDVLGTIELSKAFGRRFQQQGYGSILNIGWDQADRGMDGDSGELFSAAKNAIMGFSRSLAVSLAPLVRVNCISPGWIRTAWGETAGDYWQQRVLQETPLKRWGEPRDIANMARFLLSDDAAYITGQVINVNGGAVR